MKELIEVSGAFFAFLIALALTVCYCCCVVNGQCSRAEDRVHNQPLIHNHAPIVHPRGPVKK